MNVRFAEVYYIVPEESRQATVCLQLANVAEPTQADVRVILTTANGSLALGKTCNS